MRVQAFYKSGAMYFKDTMKRGRKRLRKDVKKRRLRFCVGRYTARKRNLEWSLSQKEYFCLIRKRCYYCGSATAKETGCGLDRLDNLEGYNIKNVVPCCWSCNNLKGSRFTPQETKVMVEALAQFRSHSKVE